MDYYYFYHPIKYVYFFYTMFTTVVFDKVQNVHFSSQLLQQEMGDGILHISESGIH